MKRNDSDRLSTVNVIVQEDASVVSLDAFPDTPAGNRAAENLFRSVCREQGEVEGIEAMVEDGLAELKGCTVFLVHATNDRNVNRTAEKRR